MSLIGLAAGFFVSILAVGFALIIIVWIWQKLDLGNPF